jgi:glycosyltransferase involved in cell wall biosynthesis
LLPEAVDSVLAQTYGELEVIVVDDGSTDDTRAVVAQRFGQDSRVHYVSKPNGGPASAQNAGFRRARGEFVGVIGDDDLWLPDKLELQVRQLDQHPQAGLSFADCVFRGGQWDGQTFFDVTGFSGTVSMWELVRRAFIPAGSVLMRKEVLDRVGHFDESLAVAEDWDLWIRFAAACPIVYVPQVVYVYRRHSGPQACDDWGRMISCKVQVLQKNESLILDRLTDDLGRRTRVRRAWRRHVNRERGDHCGAVLKELLQSDPPPSRRELMPLLRRSIGYAPGRLKHYRRFVLLMLFGARFGSWWYGGTRDLFLRSRDSIRNQLFGQRSGRFGEPRAIAATSGPGGRAQRACVGPGIGVEDPPR